MGYDFECKESGTISVRFYCRQTGRDFTMNIPVEKGHQFDYEYYGVDVYER